MNMPHISKIDQCLKKKLSMMPGDRLLTPREVVNIVEETIQQIVPGSFLFLPLIMPHIHSVVYNF